jgi:hypothetical protein
MRAVNLIPADQRTGTSVGAGRSEGAAYAVLGLLAGVAVLALLYGIAHHQIASRRGEVVSLQARAQTKEAEANRLAPYTSFIALREERTKAVAQLVDSRFDWAHVFHEFGRVMPPFVAITSISGSVGSPSDKAGGAAGASTSASASSTSGSGASGAGAGKGASSVTSATPPGTVPTFTVTGCALTQSLVALTLERLRLMDGASAVTLESSTASTSSGGGGGGEACPPGAPVFNAQITFNPLPASAAPGSSGTTETTAANSTGGAR